MTVAFSIVIVSYNVSFFLQQTLESVAAAIEGLNAEVWVVDNASADDSVEMVQSQFPWVKLIANQENVGFSKANNQALRQAVGKYHLLLNPDVIIAEDTLKQCFDFLESHPDCGGLGVRMIDGAGIYLPESKRGLPTPWVSFCKIVGLTTLFPKSEVFARYYMGHLSADHIQQIDVLSGAFMAMPKEVLEKVGLLDEDFFMYGEDVDLSYRIILGGYKNYYLPSTTIIHYKGESTKKGSLKYVKVFYHAMAIFARKHFLRLKTNASFGLDFAIQIAINLRASLAIIVRFWDRFKLPLLDAILIFIGMYLLKEYWQDNHKRVPGLYPPSFIYATIPSYIVAWLSSVWLFGGYRAKPKAEDIVRGLVIGMVLISATTNFFDDWRYSKALILLGTAWAICTMIGWRLTLHLGQYGNLRLGENKSKRILIVAEPQEGKRIESLINTAKVNSTIVGLVNKSGQSAVAKLPQLVEAITVLGINEVVLSGNDLSNLEIIDLIGKHKIQNPPTYRVVPRNSQFIIGSSDKNNQGDYYSSDSSYALFNPDRHRQKRLSDIVLALGMLVVVMPLSIIKKINPLRLIAMSFKVLNGATWVGTSKPLDAFENEDVKVLNSFWKKFPKYPKAIFSPSILTGTTGPLANKVDALYIKEYNHWLDLQYIWLGLGKH